MSNGQRSELQHAKGLWRDKDVLLEILLELCQINAHLSAHSKVYYIDPNLSPSGTERWNAQEAQWEHIATPTPERAE